MQEDTDSSLGDIRDRYPDGLIHQLLEVQKHQIAPTKCLEWAKNPMCLRRVSQNPRPKRKRGTDNTQVSNAAKKFDRVPGFGAKYVAVSYTSDPSEEESPDVGGYCITGSAQGNPVVPARVRDCILHRASKYAEFCGVDLIWIDGECIDRDNQDEHEMAIQSMDLIYSFSKHPVGLLTKPIKRDDWLGLLDRLLDPNFVETSGGQELKSGVSVKDALTVLDLLDYITSDKWWTRAWIFQEAYLSSVRMHLLIPHSISLNRVQKQKDWCRIPGELRVNLVTFYKRSTLFCLDYLQQAEERWQGGRAKCEDILSRARQYNVLDQQRVLAGNELAHKAMSPSIFADIGRREISWASDLLAIAANCCDYSIRLDTKSLIGNSCSLSISILALYLLNGEIIMNHKHDESLFSKKIFDYLQLLAFDTPKLPAEIRKLTFLKRCRLVQVRLSPDGIQTSGRLWKLYTPIDTGKFKSRAQIGRETESLNGLNEFQRSRLRQLSKELRSRTKSYQRLADDLDRYLYQDTQDQSSPAKQYMDLMAEEVVEAIRNRRTIHLGCLAESGSYHNPYRGIFVTDSTLETPSYVFTAWRPAGYGGKRQNDIHAEAPLDKIVSLEVDITGYTLKGLPRLMTKRWINGLCFFDKNSAHDVVFNYPKSLTG